MEEVLFSRCKYEIRPAIHTLEDSILKLRHSTLPVATWIMAAKPLDSAALFLLNLPATFLPVPFAGQRLLGPELLSRLQVKRVPFDLFNDVLLLDFALEAAKGILQRFALLKLNFSQTKNTSPLDLVFGVTRRTKFAAHPPRVLIS